MRRKNKKANYILGENSSNTYFTMDIKFEYVENFYSE